MLLCVSTFYRPELDESINTLKQMKLNLEPYDNIFLVSRNTDEHYKIELSTIGKIIEFDSDMSVGDMRRLALEVIIDEDVNHAMVSDLDRLLFMVSTDSGRFNRFIRHDINKHDFYMFFRRDNGTYPIQQFLTEQMIANMVNLISDNFSVVDVSTAMRIVSNDMAKFLLKHSKVSGFEIDMEWFLIADVLGKGLYNIGYNVVPGANWEHPFFDEQIYDDERHENEYIDFKRKREKDIDDWQHRINLLQRTCELVRRFKDEY